MEKRTRPLSLTTVSLAILMAAGCSWGFGPGETEVPEMHRQLSRTVDIQSGIVLGDVQRARSAATWIATHEEVEHFPAALDSYRAEIRGYAALIAQSENLEAMALRMGQVAVACGRCHEATKGGPRFVLGTGPAQGTPEAQRMIVHLWAADRMWEGLVGPSDEAWVAGAQALASSRIVAQESPPSSARTSQSEETYAKMEFLVQEALAAATLEARGSVYGKLLSTCNGCHRSMEVLVEG